MLLLVHGVSEQEYIGAQDKLRAKWVNLLRRGLEDAKQSSHKIDAVLDQCRMIFYADLTDPDRGTNLKEARDAGVAQYEREIDRELDVELARKRGAPDSPAAHQMGEFADRFPGLRHRMVRLLAREAYGYFDRPGAVEEVDQRCVETIDGEKVELIVSHSFGSVVAYRLLSQHPGLVERLVTLGSPLGFSFARKANGADRASPFKTLSKWSDFADPDDIVSYVPNHVAATVLGDTNRFTTDRTIRNMTDDQHSIQGYLAQPAVVAAVVDAFAER